MFYVYVDLTTLNEPFYVGYGSETRVKNLTRNKKHTNISKTHGQNRVIVHETNSLKEAQSIECFWIDQCGTFVDNQLASKIACNFTLGGEGGRHAKEKIQLSKSHLGRLNAFYGKSHTQKAKQKIGKANEGKKRTKEFCDSVSKRNKMSWKSKSDEEKSALFAGQNNPMFGKKHSDEAKMKMKLKRKQRQITQETRNRLKISAVAANKKGWQTRRLNKLRLALRSIYGEIL